MSKSLEKIDWLYKENFKHLPKMERIDYCKTLIDVAQVSLSKNTRLIDSEWEEDLYQIIFAAQIEIAKIHDEND
ncbi:MAG: hypothetical protein H0X46_09760 [Bacteroidetes bacterium]|nr:hypothetical protein [Bacteroidota bacterium]